MARQRRISLKQTPSTFSNRYLYQFVANELRARITDQIYGRQTRIPSVEQLSNEFKVSTITIRRAIRDLSLEGLLVGRQGLGVFVAEETRIIRTISADRMSPIEVDMKAAGFKADLRDLGVSVVSVTDNSFLSVLSTRQSRIYRLERLLLADEKPVGLDTIWLPRPLADKLKNHMKGQFIISLLKKFEIFVDYTTYQIEAITANEMQAAMLDVLVGSPLLVIRFFPVAADGKVILVGRNITRADRFTYEFEGSNGSK